MFIKRFLLFGTLSLLPAFSQDADSSATWREAITETQVPAEGCFQVTYPNTVWEQVECKVAHPNLHPHPVFRDLAGGQVTNRDSTKPQERLACRFEVEDLASIPIPKYHINTQTTDNVSSLYFQRKTTGVSLTSLR
jgi:hypothetical protein